MTFSELIAQNIKVEYADDASCDAVMTVMDLLNALGASDAAEVIDVLMSHQSFVVDEPVSRFTYSLTDDPVTPVSTGYKPTSVLVDGRVFPIKY
ncbi:MULTISPECIES: hypothetical protein [unclassified Ensifer]|uniref:hypothetical protein n=1 Tax=unclassified Ensifer TaxID=2633371 RepID=UPI0008132DA0|nr:MULTISPECIES: hypothetical protein [unclassified Ensifer]OCP21942.1 hypothetical protein BC361_25575 [Ensifer sp. LC54]OCP23278.1 hypothetical protein BC363_25190 [Ensifer sp. LC384]